MPGFPGCGSSAVALDRACISGRSAITEVYPSLWRRGFALEGRTADQHDAFCIAAWLAHADRNGTLGGFLKPDLSPAERGVAQVEGWILGVPGLI
jgi:hypothetical protein